MDAKPGAAGPNELIAGSELLELLQSLSQRPQRRAPPAIRRQSRPTRPSAYSGSPIGIEIATTFAHNVIHRASAARLTTNGAEEESVRHDRPDRRAAVASTRSPHAAQGAARMGT